MVPAFPGLARQGKTEEITQKADREPAQKNDLIEVQRSIGDVRGRNEDHLTSSCN